MSNFSAWHWLIALGFAWLLWRALRGMLSRAEPAAFVCTTCGHHGPPVIRTRGSFGLEVALWVLLIVPGVIYSIWRLTTRGNACASCGSSTLVPPDSPVGRRLLAEHPPVSGAELQP